MSLSVNPITQIYVKRSFNKIKANNIAFCANENIRNDENIGNLENGDRLDISMEQKEKLSLEEK